MMIRTTQPLLFAEGGYKMVVLKYVLIVLEVIASVALTVVVLLQSSKDAGLGAISGGTDTYMGKNKGSRLDQIAAKSTVWLAIVWAALALALSLF